jgi:poly(3-hydroxybutyrate) depolymerase
MTLKPPLLIALLASLIVTLPWERDGAVTYGFQRQSKPTPQQADLETPEYSRTTVFFDSQGVACHAWLYQPKHTTEPPPMIVMAHGLGAQKDFGLHR